MQAKRDGHGRENIEGPQDIFGWSFLMLMLIPMAPARLPIPSHATQLPSTRLLSATVRDFINFTGQAKLKRKSATPRQSQQKLNR